MPSEEKGAKPQSQIGLRSSELLWMGIIFVVALVLLRPLNEAREESLKPENLPKIPGTPIPDFTIEELYQKYGPDKVSPPVVIAEQQQQHRPHQQAPNDLPSAKPVPANVAAKYSRKQAPLGDTTNFGPYEQLALKKAVYAVVRRESALPKAPPNSRILELGVGALFVRESTSGVWWHGRELRYNASARNFFIDNDYDGVVHQNNLVLVSTGEGLAPMPQIVHLVWDSDTLPTAVVTWSKAMLQKYPDWQVVTWTPSDILRLRYGPVNRAQIEAATSSASKADLIKYEVLYWFGGVVLNADHVWTGGDIDKAVAEVNSRGIFVLKGNRDPILSNSFIAATPRHPVVLSVNKLVRLSAVWFSGQAAWFATGDMAWTQAVLGMSQPGNRSPYDLASLVLNLLADFDISSVAAVAEERSLICRSWEREWHKAVRSDKVHLKNIEACSKSGGLAYDMGFHVNRLNANNLNITHIHK